MNKVYARKTSVNTIDNSVAQNFVNEHHSQQSASPSSTMKSVGLFYQGELIAVAQFCSPRTSAKKREYTTELLRMCFKNDYRIVGGASKLIQFYKNTYNPSDIFTYQDTTGEDTKVYEHCGFCLVSQSKKKQYLVAPNQTLLTASKNEKLTIAYASHLGPDNILGANLGEKFHEDGERKTNIQLFTDELGWHIEETSGDKVYEWFNDSITFYTYKITATDSDKYYFGVSHIRKPVADTTIRDCVNDGYFGSGGKHNSNNKFNNWKKKHEDVLHKEVLALFERKSEAYLAEKKLVGESWRTDPNCLNSIEGGRYTGIHTGNSARFSEKECSVHGMTNHAGKTCCKCTAEKSVVLGHCEIHGETKFSGRHCRKCLNASNVTMRECVVHGHTKHVGSACYKCLGAVASSLVKKCKTHGEYTGKSCFSCDSEKVITVQNCEIHGETKFVGKNCKKCSNVANITIFECAVHGNTKHIGSTCYKCRNNKYSVKSCSVHGETAFVGTDCVKCEKSTSVDRQLCATHGLTKHMDNVCAQCRSSNAINMRECVTHGLTKHRGKTCSKCTADKAAHRLHDKTKAGCSVCTQQVIEGSRVPAESVAVEEKVCPMCDKRFLPKSSRQIFCSNPHPANCASCGVQIAPVPRQGKKRYACAKRSCRGAVNAV